MWATALIMLVLQGTQAGDVHDFEPVSDFSFAELRVALLEEYQLASALCPLTVSTLELTSVKPP